MKILTITFQPCKEDKTSVEVICDYGENEVIKKIPAAAKPIRFSAVLDNDGTLADVEVVTTS